MSVISISVPVKELKEFDEVWRRAGHSSRSDAARDALHAFVVHGRWRGALDAPGHFLMSIVYEEKKKHQVLQKIHASGDIIQSSMHTHFDGKCVEQLVLKGETEGVRALVEGLNAIPGVRVCNCSV
jgi:CopG family nickel-responsive transcriptional regulator